MLGCGGDKIDHSGHLVEFFRADIRAVGEAEVDLFEILKSAGNDVSTYLLPR